MKVRISLTADNGDTLVEAREIDLQLMQFTPIYSATLIWELTFKPILEMVKVFQEVEDEVLVIDYYEKGLCAGNLDRLSGQDSSEGSADNEAYRRGYVAGYKNA